MLAGPVGIAYRDALVAARTVSREYLRDDGSRLFLMHGGVASFNFILPTDSGQAFVIRVDGRKLSDALGDLMNLSAAASCGVAVPVGSWYVRVRGSCCVMIRPYIEGQAPGADSASDLGQVLATIHRASMRFYRPSVYAGILTMDEQVPRLAEPLESLRAECREIYHLTDTASLRGMFEPSARLTHGDFKPANILRCTSSTPIILDWEKSGSCSPLFDLSLALYHFAAMRKTDGVKSALALLQTYEEEAGTILCRKEIARAVRVASRLFVWRDLLMPEISSDPRRTVYLMQEVYPAHVRYRVIEEYLLESIECQ